MRVQRSRNNCTGKGGEPGNEANNTYTQYNPATLTCMYIIIYNSWAREIKLSKLMIIETKKRGSVQKVKITLFIHVSCVSVITL